MESLNFRSSSFSTHLCSEGGHHVFHRPVGPILVVCAGESLCEVKTEADSSDHTEHSPDDKSRPYLCAVCDKRFTTEESLTGHSRIHTGGSWYTCSQCGKRFVCLHGLFLHMNIHRGKFKCTECGRCCASSQHLAEHRRTHSGEKPFECTVCGKPFTTSSCLVDHSKIHSEDRPYKCYVCGKAFRRFYEIQVHMRVHTGEKPHKCSLCNKSFRQSSNLQQHKRSVHSSTADELKQDENV